jgi:hypothetical protein
LKGMGFLSGVKPDIGPDDVRQVAEDFRLQRQQQENDRIRRAVLASNPF